MSLLSRYITEFPSSYLKDYEIHSKLGTGGYSEIFSAETTKFKKSSVVIKSPFLSKNSGVKLHKEVSLMLKLKDVQGVPQVLDSLIDDDNEYLVVEKLGKSMEMLIKEHLNFSLKSVIIIAQQLLNIIKDVHDRGIIHRDIKPGNILISNCNNDQVFLIDYGLAKYYKNKKGVHKFFNVKKNSFKGTLMFASRNSHLGYSSSRRDDLESLGYTLAFLYKGYLPWSNYFKMNLDVRTIGKIKNQFFAQGLFTDFPEEFKDYFKYVGKLKFEEIPDYAYLTSLFLSIAKRYDFDMKNNQYEWSDYSMKPTDSSENTLKLKEDNRETDDNEDEIKEDSTDSFQDSQKNIIGIHMSMSPLKFGKIGFDNEKTKQMNKLKTSLKNVFLQN